MSEADEDYDLTFMQATEPVFGTHIGMQLINVHGRSQCEGRGIPCCIHEPSDHGMATWPMVWRSDTQVMERLCPHGVGHPDPDHMAYVRSLTPEHECPHDTIADWWRDAENPCLYPHLEWQGIHGCDGCCV